MVGPISFDELEKTGLISFAACVVMSRQRWQEDQVRLRQESFLQRQKAQAKMNEDIHRFNANRSRYAGNADFYKEKEYRTLLDLPVEGRLELRQIKKAYRVIAKTAHPDAGGSHEKFITITQARDTLVEMFPV